MTDRARRPDADLCGPEPDIWQVRQVGEPRVTERNPAVGRAIGLWFNRLRDRKQPSPYQICLATHVAQAGRGR